MESSGTTTDPVIIVGAGISGLVCAAQLVRAGCRVRVFEASSRAGGRLRTDSTDGGFLLDRGFQVLLDAYPGVVRHLDLESLDVRAFDPGAWIWTGRRKVPLADPFRMPSALLRDVTSSVMPVTDKLRLARLAIRVKRSDWRCVADAVPVPDVSSETFLRNEGFSGAFINRFARPFWGGVGLDPTLSFSSGLLLFTLKMFLEGHAVLPRLGMGAIPAALASSLPAGIVTTGHRVDGLLSDGAHVTGVQVGGEALAASAVVIATESGAAYSLTNLPALKREQLGNVTVYLGTAEDPGLGKLLMLDGTGRLGVGNLAQLSAVQPSYAPPGQHLLSAVILDPELFDLEDDALVTRVISDVQTMLSRNLDLRVLRIDRIANALDAQPAGVYGTLPSSQTDRPGLYLAGDVTVDASINGAILSGELAAGAVLAKHRSAPTSG